MRLLEFIQQVKPGYVADRFHSFVIDHLQEAVRTGENVLVSSPPGSGKTELVSILFPAWLIAEDVNTHVISLANSDSLSRMAAGNILRLVQSPAFQEICPMELDKATEQTFLVKGNDGRPTLHAAGINGQLTGHRAKYLIFDDLLKSLSEAYSETVREKVWNNFNSAAETRLLPNGSVFGIQTRWHLQDPIGKLLARATDNPDSRQFTYLSFAATNSGGQSFVFRTQDKSMDYLAPYKSLATVKGQPYSFSPKAIRGKKADLGPVMFSTLYMQTPVAQEAQMFPPEVWGTVESPVITEDYTMIVSGWDTAAKDKNTNDPSANVVVGRRASGDFVVLDAAEFRLSFDKLFPVVIERTRLLAERMKQLPLLVIEDASSGTQLADLIQTTHPKIPLVRAKAIHSKIVRAEGITPITSARGVSLLKADWNAQFIADLANFPASDRDHFVDAFVHGIKIFTTTGSEFKSEWNYLPPAPRNLADMSDGQIADVVIRGELPAFDTLGTNNFGRENF